jgi:hypothetical protein
MRIFPWKNYLKDIAGSIMPLTAVMLPLILGMAGVGFDVSVWMMHRRDLQSAADAAAVAAAYELAGEHGIYLPENFDPDDEENTSYPEYAAIKEAEINGFNPERGELEVEISLNDDGLTMVTASIEQQDHVYFSSLLFREDVYTSAAAASVVLEPVGDFCLLALDPSADGAVTAVGAVEIEAEGCGIAVNSNSDEAFDLTGNVSISISDLNIAGGMDVGANVDLEYDSAATNSSRIPDPYQNLEVPDYDGCDYTDFSVTGDAVLEPGVYCGGISISGNGDIEFEPGVYIIDGGDFRVTGNGTMTGEEVSFILTDSNESDYGQLNISGGKEIAFTAPEEGDEMAGVVFYQDRNAPDSGQCNSLTGTSAIELQGAAYFPSQCFTIGGNNDSSSSQSDPCTRIIAKTIKLHGNPAMGNNCEGTAAADIGRVRVRLVL